MFFSMREKELRNDPRDTKWKWKWTKSWRLPLGNPCQLPQLCLFLGIHLQKRRKSKRHRLLKSYPKKTTQRHLEVARQSRVKRRKRVMKRGAGVEVEALSVLQRAGLAEAVGIAEIEMIEKTGMTALDTIVVIEGAETAETGIIVIEGIAGTDMTDAEMKMTVEIETKTETEIDEEVTEIRVLAMSVRLRLSRARIRLSKPGS